MSFLDVVLTRQQYEIGQIQHMKRNRNIKLHHTNKRFARRGYHDISKAYKSMHWV